MPVWFGVLPAIVAIVPVSSGARIKAIRLAGAIVATIRVQLV